MQVRYNAHLYLDECICSPPTDACVRGCNAIQQRFATLPRCVNQPNREQPDIGCPQRTLFLFFVLFCTFPPYLSTSSSLAMRFLSILVVVIAIGVTDGKSPKISLKRRLGVESTGGSDEGDETFPGASSTSPTDGGPGGVTSARKRVSPTASDRNNTDGAALPQGSPELLTIVRSLLPPSESTPKQTSSVPPPDVSVMVGGPAVLETETSPRAVDGQKPESTETAVAVPRRMTPEDARGVSRVLAVSTKSIAMMHALVRQTFKMMDTTVEGMDLITKAFFKTESEESVIAKIRDLLLEGVIAHPVEFATLHNQVLCEYSVEHIFIGSEDVIPDRMRDYLGVYENLYAVALARIARNPDKERAALARAVALYRKVVDGELYENRPFTF